MIGKSFLKNILTMMKGTSVAQLTPILLSPILTRLYSPSEFGVYAIYLSALSILTPIVNSRYELAIMLPENKRKSYAIFSLSLLINILVTFILLMTIVISSDLFGLIPQGGMSYLLPVSVLLIGVMNPLIYMSNREQQFTALSNAKIKQTLGTGLSQVLFGWLKFGAIGMLMGNIIGIIIMIMGLGRNKQLKDGIKESKMSKEIIKEAAIEYKEFPKYAMVTHTIEAVTSNTPQLFLQKIYGASSTGFYSLSMRTVNIPISLVSKSIGDVFLSSASKEYRERGNCSNIYNKTFLLLLMLPIVPFIILYFTAVDLFALIFGQEWSVAGELVKILIPALYFNFIANPLAHMFIIAEKVKLEFIFQLAMFILAITIFLIAALNSVSLNTTIQMYSGVLLIKNIVSILFSYKFSRGGFARELSKNEGDL